ncbi:MAG: TetR/AcrR family transcriptional regulator [Thermodesulfobacteriota bacterium]
MMRKGKQKEKKERRIAQAALRLFSTKGYRAASVDRIAEEAGVGKGTIYEYYDSKSDIFLAATKEWMMEFQEKFQSRLSEIEDPVEQLQAVARMNVELIEPLDPVNARMTVEVIRQGILEDGVIFGRRNEMRDVMQGMQKIVEKILLTGISRKLFKAEIARDVSSIAANFLAYLDGIMLHGILSENHFQIKEKVGGFMEILMHEILTDPDKQNGKLQ